MVATTTKTSSSNGGTTSPNVMTRSKRQQTSEEVKPLSKRIKGDHGSSLAETQAPPDSLPQTSLRSSTTAAKDTNTTLVPQKSHEENFPKRPQKIALFRKSADGFYFSSTRNKSAFDQSKIATDTSKSMVSMKDIELLQHPKFRIRHMRRDRSPSVASESNSDQNELIEDLDEGSKTTEMNNITSEQNDVTLQSDSNLEGKDSETNNELIKAQEPVVNGYHNTSSQIDKELFLEEGIDVDILLKDIEKKEEYDDIKQEGLTTIEENDNVQTSSSAQIEEVLLENNTILRELQRLQDERFLNDPKDISKHERELAVNLERRLADLTVKVPPSKLVSSSDIEKAANEMVIFEAAFKGQLPPQKQFAYSTNNTTNSAFPPNATRVPAEQAKNQRLQPYQNFMSMKPMPSQEMQASSTPTYSIPRQSSIRPISYTSNQQSPYPESYPLRSQNSYPQQVAYHAPYMTAVYPALTKNGFPTTPQVAYPYPAMQHNPYVITQQATSFGSRSHAQNVPMITNMPSSYPLLPQSTHPHQTPPSQTHFQYPPTYHPQYGVSIQSYPGAGPWQTGSGH